MATGGITRRKVGVLAGVGCVTIAVLVAVSGILSGSPQVVSTSNRTGAGKAPATTAVAVPTTVPSPAPDIETSGQDPTGTDPEAPPVANSSDATPGETPAVIPTDAVPAEVGQVLAELASQLEQAGDDGGPQEMTREEVDALVTAQLQALGIVL